MLLIRPNRRKNMKSSKSPKVKKIEVKMIDIIVFIKIL